MRASSSTSSIASRTLRAAALWPSPNPAVKMRIFFCTDTDRLFQACYVRVTNRLFSIHIYYHCRPRLNSCPVQTRHRI